MTIIDNWSPPTQPASFLASPTKPDSLLASPRRLLGLALLVIGAGSIVYAVLDYLDPNLTLITTMFTRGIHGFLVSIVHLIVSLPLILLGATLASPTRRVLLFLRRFKSHSNVVVGQALASPVTWPFRTVTLDDEHYPSRGVPLGPQLVIWASAASIIALFAILYSRAARAAIGSELLEINPGAYLATIEFWPFYVAMVTFVMTAHFTRVRRRARMNIRSRKRLTSLKYRMQSSRRWWRRSILMSGHSTIVSVSTTLWHDAVSTAMLEADVVVIDVSEPSDSIAWEVEQARTLGCRTLLIGSLTALESWVSTEDGTTQEGAIVAEPSAALRFRAAIGDEPVLAYVSKNDESHRRFRDNLGDALADLTGTVRSTHAYEPWSGWQDRIADMAFYGALLLVVVGWPVLMVDMILAFTLPYQKSSEFFEWKHPIGLSLTFYGALLGPVRKVALSFGLGHLMGRLVP